MFWVFIKKGCVFFNQVLKALLIGLCFLIFLILIVSFGVQAFWTWYSIVKYPELFVPNSDLNYVSYAFAWKFEFLSFSFLRDFRVDCHSPLSSSWVFSFGSRWFNSWRSSVQSDQLMNATFLGVSNLIAETWVLSNLLLETNLVRFALDSSDQNVVVGL